MNEILRDDELLWIRPELAILFGLLRILCFCFPVGVTGHEGDGEDSDDSGEEGDEALCAFGFCR